ncbi:hypothetical protein RHGRI_001011 [Rhododendron griersonianum]|nr:hypothetical protein RHGRI_001011 [Rhododendron griersonianum]
MAEKSEILYVQSRTFQTVQRDFHIVVYPRGKVNETHLGVFLKPEEPSCDQIHFSFVTLCIVNKNDFSMSVTRNYPNPIRKIGSDEFISFKDLLDSSQGYVDNGSIKFVIKVLTLKETISKDREELNNVYRLDLSGEFVIWRVDNFSAFIDFLVGGLILESQPFEVHGCASDG